VRKIMTYLPLALLALFGALPAFAEEAAGPNPYGGIGAAIAIGVAAFGGAIGQGLIGAAALQGTARNPAAQPKIQTMMIIGLALVESLVLYAFVVAWVKIKA
jgi:F-type H+-transporting ATPase subunit c